MVATASGRPPSSFSCPFSAETERFRRRKNMKIPTISRIRTIGTVTPIPIFAPEESEDDPGDGPEDEVEIIVGPAVLLVVVEDGVEGVTGLAVLLAVVLLPPVLLDSVFKRVCVVELDTLERIAVRVTEAGTTVAPTAEPSVEPKVTLSNCLPWIRNMFCMNCGIVTATPTAAQESIIRPGAPIEWISLSSITSAYLAA
jgi:hypothetical protein